MPNVSIALIYGVRNLFNNKDLTKSFRLSIDNPNNRSLIEVRSTKNLYHHIGSIFVNNTESQLSLCLIMEHNQQVIDGTSIGYQIFHLRHGSNRQINISHDIINEDSIEKFVDMAFNLFSSEWGNDERN